MITSRSNDGRVEAPLAERRLARGLALLMCAVVAWFYVWTARSNGEPWRFGNEQRDYYNLLIDGWLDGQLHMKVDVPAELKALANPYDPDVRRPGLGLHDASYYNGKYFVYFGPAPVVTLMLPFRLITGVDLPLPAAIVVLACGGFWVSANVWLFLRRRYFPDASVALCLVGIVALATASMVPLLLRRPNIWELPLSAGYFFSMTALAFVSRSLHAERSELRWLAAASGALGLAVASRPTYLFAGLLLVIPLVWRWRIEMDPATRWRRILPRAMAVFLPIACIGAGVALYNWIRFGNPLEFGVRYMFSGVHEAKMRHFSWEYLLYNLKLYFFQPAEWGWYFPFLHAVKPSPFPPGYYGFEFVFGLLRNSPLLWLGLATPFLVVNKNRGRLFAVVLSIVSIAAGPALMLACFYAAMARYQTDFAPSLTLAACVGALAVEAWAQRQGRVVRFTVRSTLLAVATVSVWFGLLASFELYGNLKRGSPTAYERLAAVANYPASWAERLAGVERGPIELTIRLPSAKRTGKEVILATGAWAAADAIFVEYQSDGQIRVGYRHNGTQDMLSRPFAVDRFGAQRWTIEMGSLWPAETHPFFGEVTQMTVWRATRRLAVEVDGDVVLEAEQRFHPAISPYPAMSEKAGKLAEMPSFSGEIVRSARDVALAQLAAERTERMIMRVQFGLQSAPMWQPLFVAGAGDARWTGVVRRMADGRLQVGFAKRGDAIRALAVLSSDAKLTRELEWIVTARGTEEVRMIVKVDGIPVGTARAPQMLSLADLSTRGAEWEHAEMAPSFEGIVHSVQRITADRPAKSGVVRLRVVFPQGKSGAREPLVVTGETGRGDQVFVEYLDNDRVRFALDHWGKPPLWSEPVAVKSGEPQVIDVALGSLVRPEEVNAAGLLPVEIRLNGRAVWKFETKLFPVEAKDVFVARNPLGGTTSGPAFTGSVLNVEFVEPAR